MPSQDLNIKPSMQKKNPGQKKPQAPIIKKLQPHQKSDPREGNDEPTTHVSSHLNCTKQPLTSSPLLARLPHRPHPLILLDQHAPFLRAHGTDHPLSQHLQDRSAITRAEQFPLELTQQRDGSAHEHGVALEDVDVPEARGVVEVEDVGEEGGVDVVEIFVGGDSDGRRRV